MAELILLKQNLGRITTGSLFIVVLTLLLAKFMNLPALWMLFVWFISLLTFFGARHIYEKDITKATSQKRILSFLSFILTNVIKWFFKSINPSRLFLTLLTVPLSIPLILTLLPPESQEFLKLLSNFGAFFQPFTSTPLGALVFSVPYLLFTFPAYIIIFGIRPPGATCILKAQAQSLSPTNADCFEKVYAHESNEYGVVTDSQVELMDRLCVVFAKSGHKKPKKQSRLLHWLKKLFRKSGKVVSSLTDQDEKLYLLRGHSGYGKSVCITRAVSKFSCSWFHFGKVPVYIPIRDLGLSNSDILSYLDKMKRNNAEKAEVRTAFWQKTMEYHYPNNTSEMFQNALKDLHSRGSVIYLFDGLNEILNLNTSDTEQVQPDDLPRKLIELLRRFCGENECLISSCPMSALKRLSTKAKTNFYVTGISPARVQKLLKPKSIIISDMAQSPFLFRLMQEAPKKIGTPYQLINTHLHDRVLNEKVEWDQPKEEILSSLANITLEAYQEQEMINPPFSLGGFIELLKLAEMDSWDNSDSLSQRPRILQKTLEGEYQFSHQRYWEYFMARSALDTIKSGSYWDVYKFMRKDVPEWKEWESLITVVSDAHLSNSMAMVLCEKTELLSDFLEHCNRALLNRHVEETAKESVISFLAGHLTAEREIIEAFSPNKPKENGVEAFVQKALSRFNQGWLREHDSAQIRNYIRLYSCLSPHMQSNLFSKIISTDSLPLQEFLLAHYSYISDTPASKASKENSDPMSEQAVVPTTFQNILTALPNLKTKTNVVLQSKDYLVCQFPYIMFQNFRNYWRFFSSSKETKWFMRIRYLDICFTSLLYVALIIWELCCFPAMIADPFNALYAGTLPPLSWATGIMLVKLTALAITLGSFHAWCLQHIHPKDVYLEIFGNASDWLTIQEIAEFIGDGTIHLGKETKLPLLSRYTEGVGAKDTKRYFMLLFDWVRVRPSVVFYLATILSLLWAQMKIPSLNWYWSILLCVGVSAVFLMPLSTYAYIFSLQSGKGKTRKGVLFTQLVMFVLMVVFVIPSIATSPQHALGVIGGLFFVFILLYGAYIYPIGKHAKKIKRSETIALSRASYDSIEEFSKEFLELAKKPSVLRTQKARQAYWNWAQSLGITLKQDEPFAVGFKQREVTMENIKTHHESGKNVVDA